MSFRASLRIYPVTMMSDRPKTDFECGGNVILPTSALQTLSRGMTNNENGGGPMLFRINLNERATHSGVLEFIAEEGHVNAPSWILDVLQAKVGATVEVSLVNLSKANFVRFQPQSCDFLDISDPRAVLENHLRCFTCLTVGDIIPIFYNHRSYFLKVQEAKPNNAVCINECDMMVDFSAPVGYVEPKLEEKNAEKTPLVQNETKFTGIGCRLDGKKPKYETVLNSNQVKPSKPGAPDFDFRVGTIEFIRHDDRDDNTNKMPSSTTPK